jgi:hypothetical protein
VKPDIKSRWTAALRSGRFKQGTGFLRTNNEKYCCLGVLCQLAVEAGVDVKVTTPEFGPKRYTYDGRVGLLPTSVQKWAGLDTGGPRAGVESLTNLNDFGVDFGRIAELIDSHL